MIWHWFYGARDECFLREVRCGLVSKDLSKLVAVLMMRRGAPGTYTALTVDIVMEIAEVSSISAFLNDRTDQARPTDCGKFPWHDCIDEVGFLHCVPPEQITSASARRGGIEIEHRLRLGPTYLSLE